MFYYHILTKFDIKYISPCARGDSMKIKTQDRVLKEKIITGKILHLDGDKKYSEKANRYYKKLGLNAVVKYIAESRQAKVVYSLLKYYQPDILVITRA